MPTAPVAEINVTKWTISGTNNCICTACLHWLVDTRANLVRAAISFQWGFSTSAGVGLSVVLPITYRSLVHTQEMRPLQFTFRSFEKILPRTLMDDKVPTVSVMISDLLEPTGPSTAVRINSSRTMFTAGESSLHISDQMYC